jgi:5-methylcytosine-specific restriction protein A
VKPAKEHAHYLTADWAAKRQRILLRDAYTCRASGCSAVVSGKAAHVDHVVPLEDGGTDDDANLQTLCAACHGAKTRGEQRRRGHVR